MSLATALKGAVADARPLQNPDFRRLWVTQIIAMIGAQLTAARLERHVEVEGLDDPEAGEVLLVSSVGGSWPYGWNRSVV